MGFLAAIPFISMADASPTAAANSIHSYVVPILTTLDAMGAIVCTLVLIWGGYLYMTTADDASRLEHAKRVIRNALIGFAIVLAAATITAILHHAYTTPAPGSTNSIPALTQIQPDTASNGWATILVDALSGLFSDIVTSLASPILTELSKLTAGTPLMADQKAVFDLWVVILAIGNGLFILVLTLLGFRVMTTEMLGLGEVELRTMLPQIGLTFLFMNLSLFAIDAVIGLSNAIISAIYAGFPNTDIWKALIDAMSHNGGLSLVALILFVVFVVLAIMLFVYYIGRMIALFVGAALSPLVVLLWLLPGFRDFANNLIRVYLSLVFVLLVHVVILMLASSLLEGQNTGPTGMANPFMDVIIAIATVLALLRTQSMIVQMSMISSGASQTRRLGKLFLNGVKHTSDSFNKARSGNVAEDIAEGAE